MIDTELSESKILDIVTQWKSSPIVRHYSFSDKKLWSKQEEILWSVRNNRCTCVASANTTGKSFIEADVVMDWLFTKRPAKVITTSSSWKQVEEILWKEIKVAVQNSKWPIDTKPLNTSWTLADDWFAIGISTDTPVNFQGFHSPHLLVLVDEASGMSKEIGDMIEALHPEAILVLGNPLQATGWFADCFHNDKWNKIKISAQECVEWQEKNELIPGLVTREWIKDMADLHGIKSEWYRVHVCGEFPDQDEYALINRSWVDRARKGLDADGLPLDVEDEAHETRIVGLDMASKHGSNESVIGYRYGHTIKSMKGYLKQTGTWVRDQVASVYTANECNIAVSDADGLGESMADMLSEMHVPSLEFHGGSSMKAMDQRRFRNLRSQFYHIVALNFEKGLYDLRQMSEKDFEILRGQLCSIRVKAPDGLGRLQIETKENMLARQVKSPDYADCFMMMEFGSFMMKTGLQTRPRSMGSL